MLKIKSGRNLHLQKIIYFLAFIGLVIPLVTAQDVHPPDKYDSLLESRGGHTFLLVENNGKLYQGGLNAEVVVYFPGPRTNYYSSKRFAKNQGPVYLNGEKIGNLNAEIQRNSGGFLGSVPDYYYAGFYSTEEIQKPGDKVLRVCADSFNGFKACKGEAAIEREIVNAGLTPPDGQIFNVTAEKAEITSDTESLTISITADNIRYNEGTEDDIDGSYPDPSIPLKGTYLIGAVTAERETRVREGECDAFRGDNCWLPKKYDILKVTDSSGKVVTDITFELEPGERKTKEITIPTPENLSKDEVVRIKVAESLENDIFDSNVRPTEKIIQNHFDYISDVETLNITEKSRKPLDKIENSGNKSDQFENNESQVKEKESQVEASIEFSSGSVEKGDNIKYLIEVNSALANKGYNFVIEDPDGQKVVDKSLEQENYLGNLTLEPDLPAGEYKARITPSGIIQNVLNALVGDENIEEKSFEVNKLDIPVWERYCKSKGYTGMNEKADCISEEIIPEYFQDSTGERVEIAQSLCSTLVSNSLGEELTYSENSHSCR